MSDTYYEIHFNEATASATSLEEYLGRLKKQIDELTKVREDLLSDKNWLGKNKSEFSKEFDNYMQQLNELYNNGLTYLQKLAEIIEEYSKAEQ